MRFISMIRNGKGGISRAALLLLFTFSSAGYCQSAGDLASGGKLLVKLNNEFKSRHMADGSDVFICSGGFYASREAGERNPGVEFRAGNAVIFYSQSGLMESLQGGNNEAAIDSPLGIYLESDVRVSVDRIDTGSGLALKDNVFTADKVYYDFRKGELYVLDGVLRFDLGPEELPIYLRAEEIRQLDKSYIEARKVKLSNDSFHEPHLWLGADKIAIDQDPPANKDGEKIPQMEVEDLTLNAEGVGTLFWWPHGGGELSGAPMPLKSLSSGINSEYGFSLETAWDLPWLLGYKEPEGSNTRLLLDGYTKRGPAVGIDSEYRNDDSFGTIRSYLVNDSGEDRLGRLESRYDVPPDDVFRGRIKWEHRQYLPQNWQATVRVNYLSDKNFLENWYEREFDREPEPETSVYLKQQENNWAFDFLYGFHLNEFAYDYVNEPKAGFYLAGQDLFDAFVYQHDGYVARYQEIAGERLVPGLNGIEEPTMFPGMLNPNRTAFGVSRHELTLPLNIGSFNFVPTAIGTYVYSDYEGANGFDYEPGRNDDFVQGVYGFRSSMQFWSLDRSAKSDLFDIDGIRHIVRPEVNMFWSDTTLDDFESQDIFNFNLKQRWQTKRGPEGNKRVVDVFKFNAGVTYVTDDVENSELPGRYIYSRPDYQFSFEPYANYDLFNLGLTERQQVNQAMHNFANSDWGWNISDMAEYSGGLNYNLTDSEVSYIDNALSVQHSSQVRYFIGHRYLANGDAFKDEPAQYLTAGSSYKLNPKYSISVSTQYDIENATGAYTRVVVLRKLPGWTTAFSAGWDSIRGSGSFQIGFWPDNYDKAVVGSRRFTKLAP